MRTRSRSDHRPACAALPPALGAALLGALAGCVTAPRATAPPAVDATGYASLPLPERLDGGDQAQQLVQGAPLPARWWTWFGNPRLDELIAAAGQANPGLEAARATLRAAQETALAQRGSLWPSVDLQYSPTRQKLAGNVAGASAPGVQGDGTALTAYQGTPAAQGGSSPFNAPVTYTYHTAQVSVGYTPDVFGSAVGQLRALEADAEAQRLELDAARITLAASIVSAAIQDALLRRELLLSEQLRDAAIAQRDLAHHQLRSGYLSRGAAAVLDQAAAQSEAALPPLRRALEQNQDQLRTLAGLAQDRPVPAFDLDEFTLPAQLPLSLPSTRVAQPPAGPAAAATRRGARRRAGVARRAMLPQLSLSADLGGTAAHFDQMFWSSGSFYSLAANLVQPVFHGGSLRHQARAASALADAAAAQYRASVLTAFQNVADALRALQADADAVRLDAAALEAADAAARSAHHQLERGDLDRLSVLTIDQARGQSELALSQARAARLGDTAALLVALGTPASDAPVSGTTTPGANAPPAPAR